MAALKSVLVTPSSAQIAAGGTQQFTATAIYSDSTSADVTAQAAWTTSDSAIATVGAATGLATGVAAGAATIQATYNLLSGEATLAVDVALVSIAVTPTNVILIVGQQQQFTATGTYSDASTADLTDTGLWNSSDPVIASIDQYGEGVAISPGVAVMVCRQNSIVGGATVTVAMGAGPPVMTPAEMLALAQQQMLLYITGQKAVAIETPQLGRVAYNETNIADLQRLIDQLQILVNPTSAVAIRRRPLSIEACP